MQRYAIPAAFSVPFATIDEEHDQIVALLNDLARGIADGSGREIPQLTDRFLAALRQHLRSEEALMDRLDYPKRKEHKLHHQECLGEITSILASAHSAMGLDRAALDEVFSILVDVVARVDLYFKEFLVEVGHLPDRGETRAEFGH